MSTTTAITAATETSIATTKAMIATITARATATRSPVGASQSSMPHAAPFVEKFFRVLVPGILDAIVVSILTKWEKNKTCEMEKISQ